jgi:hypothetical protein
MARPHRVVIGGIDCGCVPEEGVERLRSWDSWDRIAVGIMVESALRWAESPGELVGICTKFGKSSLKDKLNELRKREIARQEREGT